MIRIAAYFCLFGIVSSIRAQSVIIREIMYRPLPGQPEYLVLSNQTRTVFDLAGWRMTQGVIMHLPEFDPRRPKDSFLQPFETVVLSAAGSHQTRAAYQWPEAVRVFGPWVGRLSDRGATVRLEDHSGRVVCVAVYSDGQAGREEPAGAAGRVVPVDPREALDDPVNWRTPGGGAGSLAGPVGPAPSELSERSRRGVTGGEQPAVIINEIMYDLPAGHPCPEYIELYNRGEAGVDLAGWRIAGGVRFGFQPGTVLAANAFLVVARDARQMRKLYGEIPVTGDFEGRLSSKGERVLLLDQSGNLIDEVHYAGGGDWPERARGRGSSLELRHPAMDNGWPSAWAASREANHSHFITCRATGVYEQARAPGDPGDYKELHLYLAEDGSAVVRGIELRHGGTNCLAHADRLGNGADGWLTQGTHWSSVATNGQLILVSEGHGDNRANHVELDVPALEPGEFYELRMEARWLSGSPRLIAQLFDQSLAGSFALPIPERLGTPGLPNSCQEPTPQIDGVTHYPAVPAPGQPIQLSARVYSTKGLREVRVAYRLYGRDWSSTPAFDDGRAGGDVVAGDGIYSASVQENTAQGDVLQYYFEAADGQGLRSVSSRPGAGRPALLVVDGRSLPEDLRLVRVVVWPEDVQSIAAEDPRLPRLSNRYWPATIIEAGRVVHGGAVRSRGSPLTRTRDLERVNVKWPADRLHRGQRRWVYDDDASKGIAYHNRVARYLLSLLDQPVSDSEFVRLVVNAGPAQLREETEPIGKEFLDRRFDDGGKGDLFKIDDQWWITDSGEGEMQDATWEYRGERIERYRNAWMKRTREHEDDYGPLLALFRQLAGEPEGTEDIDLNAEAILRVAAVRGLIGDWDNFTMQRGRNGYFYRPPGEKGFRLLHWDSDEAFLTGPPLHGRFIEGWLKRGRNQERFNALVRQLIDITVDRPERFRTWLALEQEATGGTVFQADYLAYFAARARELREASPKLFTASIQDTPSRFGTVQTGTDPGARR